MIACRALAPIGTLRVAPPDEPAPERPKSAEQDADRGRRVAALAERHEEGLEMLSTDRAEGVRYASLA